MKRTEYGTALVTGGGSGIGRATALDLAHRGAKVVVADLRAEASASVAAEIQASGGVAIGIGMDVADSEAVNAGFDEAEAVYGGIDILVNSAGLLLVEPILDFSLASWTKVMSVNVTGTFLCSQRAGQGMAERRYGRIVNIASVSGIRAGVGRAAYGTSKAAIFGLTRQFALELAGYGITANAVAPGVVETPMTLDAYGEETWKKTIAMIPARRTGTPEEIAAAVAYLAGPDAGYVNGEILTVDGGYVAAGMTQTGALQV